MPGEVRQTGVFHVGTPPVRARSGAASAAFAVGALGVVCFGFLTLSMVLRGGVAVRPGWDATFVAGGYRVADTDAAAEAAGLRAGARIETVAGDGEAWFYGPAKALARVPAGATYTVTVREGERDRSIGLRLPRTSGSWRDVAPNLIVCALLYTLGLWIGAVKFRDPTGRLAALTFLLTVFTFFAVIVGQFPGWNAQTSTLALAVANLARPLNLAVGYDFYSRFPERPPERAGGVVLRRALYVVAVLLWFPLNVPALARAAGAAPGGVVALLMELSPAARPLGFLVPAYETLAAVLMGAVLIRNYRRLRDADSRRRLRWAGLAFGSTLGIYVVFALLKMLSFLTGSAALSRLMDLANGIATLVIGLACVALAYAVARHRVLGIHVVVRRGVQYLLAKRALQGLTVLPAAVLAFQALRHSARSIHDLLLREPWPFYLLVSVTGAVSLRYRRRVRLWLDRKFFLPQLEQERVLVSLAEGIKASASEADVWVTAAREIDAALHPQELHILVRGERQGVLRVAHSRAIDRAVRLRDWLNGDGSGLLVEGGAFSVYSAESTAAELLIVPIAGTDRTLTGALALGTKRSEQPYTRKDRDLLQAVAGQMALMYEVLRLKESVAEEKRVRVEVLGHLGDRLVELLNECPECGRCYAAPDQTCPKDGATLTLTLPVERTIEGKYRLERRIGRGGMGVVYEAADLRLARPVAIKIMTGDLFGNSQAMARFEREARAAAAMNHPNVVRVYDFGRLPAGGAFLVMEVVAGANWRERLRKRGRIAPAEVAHWMGQLCSAMEAAHARGIVHRDLKPENLMIAADEGMDRVVVLDFGLAKLRAAYEENELTVSGAVMGTRGYMSPEQRAGRKVDAATDVFALAVICAETLTGRRPPRSGASREWMEVGLRAMGAGGSGLAVAIGGGLMLNPARRPSAGEFWQELAPVLAQAGAAPGFGISGDDVETLSIRAGEMEE